MNKIYIGKSLGRFDKKQAYYIYKSDKTGFGFYFSKISRRFYKWGADENLNFIYFSLIEIKNYVRFNEVDFLSSIDKNDPIRKFKK